MNEAIAYNQSDLYKRLRNRKAVTAKPLLEEIENFDFNTCADNLQTIEDFIARCLRPVEILAYIALNIAKDASPIEPELKEWLFNLSATIDEKIIYNPIFNPGISSQAARLESAAADLAYATGLIDLNNSFVMSNANKGIPNRVRS